MILEPFFVVATEEHLHNDVLVKRWQHKMLPVDDHLEQELRHFPVELNSGWTGVDFFFCLLSDKTAKFVVSLVCSL